MLRRLFIDPNVHDLEWLFHVKFCLSAGTSSVGDRDNCVKTNKDKPVVSVAQIFSRNCNFGDIRFVRIFVRFSRKEASNVSDGVAR